MGNALGGKKTTKVMKMDGETMKLKTPVRAGEVLREHPGLVLLESEAVRHYGIRAKPVAAEEELRAKRLYFLVELPREAAVPARRVRSGINMSAKDRLESLVLARRSASDLTLMKAAPPENGGLRLKMRLPKAQLESLMQGCATQAEAAHKIIGLCMPNAALQTHCQPTAGETSKPRQKRVSFMPISEGGSTIAVAS